MNYKVGFIITLVLVILLTCALIFVIERLNFWYDIAIKECEQLNSDAELLNICSETLKELFHKCYGQEYNFTRVPMLNCSKWRIVS